MSSHPIHPATVHYPIAFTTLTAFLDVFHAAATNPSTASLVASVLKTADISINQGAIPQLSYYTNLLTIITAVPSIISGAVELAPLIQRDGLSSKKAQTGVLHALVNDLQVFGAVYNWWTRRSVRNFEPDTTNLVISAGLALPACLFAAYLGGSLVYNYGMGVGRGTGSKVKKSQ